MNLTHSTIALVLSLAYKELDGMSDHTSPESAAKAIQAAEEENGEAIRRIMSQVPDLPVDAFPLVSLAYGLASLAHLGGCKAACWAECRTYATRLLVMMNLPAPDSDGFQTAVVAWLERHQDQLHKLEEVPVLTTAPVLDARDPGDEDREPHPVKTNRGPCAPSTLESDMDEVELARMARHTRG